jgi:nitrite reductase (NADH) large subunit
MTAQRYVIIGNGMAGIAAAQDIRGADAEGHITLIGDEGTPFYYRASLSEWIAGDNDDAAMPGRTQRFYDHLRIEQVTGHVTQVDPEAQTLIFEDGRTRPYDELLIATGAAANTFPVEGLDEVQIYRTWAHAREIRETLGCCGRALILGGGILGLELAGALKQMDIRQIAVVQRRDFVGPPLLDKPAAEWLQARMRADGVDLFLSDTVERVTGETAHFESGKTWDFDLFVQSVGVHPVYPEVPGLEVGRGIRIDERAATNLPHIYAAGDCTETYHADTDTWRTTRIWLDCARQGRVAACNMTGRDASLTDYPFFNASVIYDVLYGYLGDPHGEGGEVHRWQGNDGYRKVHVVEGKLAGALLLKSRHGMMAMYAAIGRPVAEYGEAIARPDFSWNELTGRDWDYLFY